MAPGCWAATLPFLKIIRVGIERMAYLPAMSRACSVLSLAMRTFGSRLLVALVNSGAITLHGPHQSAQKSTTTGMSFLVMCLSKVVLFNSVGAPENSKLPHLPHLADRAGFDEGTLFVAAHLGHTICDVSDMKRSLGNSVYSPDSAPEANSKWVLCHSLTTAT